MKTSKGFVLGIAVAGLFTASVLAPTIACAGSPPPPPGQVLRRLASNFTAFDGTQILVDEDATAGGNEIYDQTVKSTAGATVMYITVQATTHDEDCSEVGMAMNCKVDGVNCNNGFGFDQDTDALPPGWIEVTGSTESFLDIGWPALSYTWCTPIAKTKKNLHEVQIFAADDEDEGGCTGLLQTVSINVDASKFNKASTDLGGACEGFPNPNPTTEF